RKSVAFLRPVQSDALHETDALRQDCRIWVVVGHRYPLCYPREPLARRTSRPRAGSSNSSIPLLTSARNETRCRAACVDGAFPASPGLRSGHAFGLEAVLRSLVVA